MDFRFHSFRQYDAAYIRKSVELPHIKESMEAAMATNDQIKAEYNVDISHVFSRALSAAAIVLSIATVVLVPFLWVFVHWAVASIVGIAMLYAVDRSYAYSRVIRGIVDYYKENENA